MYNIKVLKVLLDEKGNCFLVEDMTSRVRIRAARGLQLRALLQLVEPSRQSKEFRSEIIHRIENGRQLRSQGFYTG